ncbi:hypothetical protein [Desulfonema magnum]|uniref:Uncharacterized protein n=1 Tax=Desulfonema magnum TaxID=45655 RepID=A0A975BN39_9BACT|nr:hypothetical protein [Desulfonema magnum]QTA88576.1 Uncharacterized protein dnm_046230 [Desulfonema magnum]
MNQKTMGKIILGVCISFQLFIICAFAEPVTPQRVMELARKSVKLIEKEGRDVGHSRY